MNYSNMRNPQFSYLSELGILPLEGIWIITKLVYYQITIRLQSTGDRYLSGFKKIDEMTVSK